MRVGVPYWGVGYLFYAISTIYLPKVPLLFESSGIYPMEIVCAILTVSLFISGRLSLTKPVKTYCLYFFFVMFSWGIYSMTADRIDLKSMLLAWRYLFFVLLIPVGRRLSSYLSETQVVRILDTQGFFVLLFAGWILGNMIQHPMPLQWLVNSYDRDYRLIGFTGNVWQNGELREIGHTSVQMGVFIATLILIYISLYLRERKLRYAVFAGTSVIGLLLTYSRSGIVVLLSGILLMTWQKSKTRRHAIRAFIVGLPLVAGILLFTKFGPALFEFGTLGKLSGRGLRDDIRVGYWLETLRFLSGHPWSILIGNGYGSMYPLIGIDTCESLFLDTLFTTGLVGLLSLAAFFIQLFRATSGAKNKPIGSAKEAILHGFHLAIPGLVCACLVGGNSLQTDFIAPLFFLLLGICSVHRLETNSSETQRG